MARRFIDKPMTLAEEWILSRFNAASGKINPDIGSREVYQVAQTPRTFWHNELCDVFIEITKWILEDEASPVTEKLSTRQTRYTVAEGALRLLHPVMPYITEHLWQKMPRRTGDPKSVMVAS
jgi:valyl-tRNA synthetase